MPVLASELKTYKAAVNNDTGGNGGRITSVLVADNVKNNAWPDIPEAERTAGSTKYRKAFAKVANDADLALQTARIFVALQTAGDDRLLIFPATQRDTQASITGSERVYGAGNLNADIAVSAVTVVVDTEAGADAIFQDGDTVWIGDGTNEEFVTIDTGGVAWGADQATLTLVTGTVNAYLAATPTKVASCIDAGTIQGTADNYAISSASGTFDDTTYPTGVDHIGGVEETITVTFTSATAFDVVGDTLGSLGSGTISANFAPNNPDFSKPYFTLDFNGWGGTWAIGDTLIFQTHPAAYPYWQKRIVPAGANSVSGNQADIITDGASA